MVWALMYCYSDGCTYWGEELISLHQSEEGAALEEDQIKLRSDPSFPKWKEYPVDGNNSFKIRKYELKP